MSVPAYKRNISKLEYVNTAYKLVEFSITHLIKVPRRLQKFITDPIISDINNLYTLVIKLKSLYYSTNESVSDKRKLICYEILGLIDHIASILNILYNHCPNLYSDSIINEWTNMLDTESKLINGIKSK